MSGEEGKDGCGGEISPDVAAIIAAVAERTLPFRGRLIAGDPVGRSAGPGA
jgi:hypothetical protein